MLHSFFTLPALIIFIISLHLDSSAGFFLPCKYASRREFGGGRHRGLYSPKVTYPTNNTVWTMGSEVVVTWDTRNMPDDISNPQGTLFLGYLDDGSHEEHINLGHPLARGFPIKNGLVSFKCPKTEVRRQYIVILFGDSGNRSPPFAIKK